MPDIDVWTIDATAASASPNQPLEQLAINFGAPGDRREADGQLWMEYPVIAGDSAAVDIETNAEATPFQHHSSLLAGVERPWVLASGLENVTELRIGLTLKSPPPAETETKTDADKSASTPAQMTKDQPAELNEPSTPAQFTQITVEGTYDVTLYFANPPLATDQVRVFDVYAQDQLLLSDMRLDPNGDSPTTSMQHTLVDLQIRDKLHIRIEAKQGTPVLSGIELNRKH